MATNIELKARCPDLSVAAERAAQLGARDAGLLVQVDTYFCVPEGRLKLRTINSERAELIYYCRPNVSSARASDYEIAAVADVESLLRVLTIAFGVKVTVGKRRRLLLWENVRIHLDEVEDLGTFLEFEAVVDESNDPTISRRRVEQLREQLEIRDVDLIERSYSDLLVEKSRVVSR